MSIIGIKMQQVAGLYKTNSKPPTKLDKKENISLTQKDEFIPSWQSGDALPTDHLNNPARTAKIAKISENISSGTYQMNYGAIAGMLINASEV